jgi:hypothetical protein
VSEARPASIVLKNLITSIEMKCNGCSKELTFGTHSAHELECPANKHPCENALLGCEFNDHPSKSHQCIFASASHELRVAMCITRFGASDLFDYATTKNKISSAVSNDDGNMEPAAKRARISTTIHSKMLVQLDEWFFGTDETKRVFACDVIIKLLESPVAEDVKKHFHLQSWFPKFLTNNVGQGVTLLVRYFLKNEPDADIFLSLVCESTLNFLSCLTKILLGVCPSTSALMGNINRLLHFACDHYLEKMCEAMLEHPSFLKTWVQRELATLELS